MDHGIVPLSITVMHCVGMAKDIQLPVILGLPYYSFLCLGRITVDGKINDFLPVCSCIWM